MGISIGTGQAKELLEKGTAQAQELIKDPSKVKDLLVELEGKLQEVPVIGETLSDIPLMASMIKAYITKEYTAVSPKVIASLVAALLYLLKKGDLIPDNIPVLGLADDLAVMGLALKISEPELKAYADWKNGRAMEDTLDEKMETM